MTSITLRPTNERDRPLIREFITRRWFGEAMVMHGEIFYPAELPGFIAESEGKMVGLVTYRTYDKQCEILSLDSLQEGQGIGARLIEAVKAEAIKAGCRRLWLITTNDNLPALRFCQKRGFELVTVHRQAVDRSRKLKPSIPLLGHGGILIRDEIELEMNLP